MEYTEAIEAYSLASSRLERNRNDSDAIKRLLYVESRAEAESWAARAEIRLLTLVREARAQETK